MAFLKRPQAGERVLQSLYESVISILDYLPTLTVRGDNKTTYVEHSAAGTIVHAKQPNMYLGQSKTIESEGGGGEYYADNTTLTLNPNTKVFSIKPPSDNTKNYALVCLSGTIQWVELDQCS